MRQKYKGIRESYSDFRYFPSPQPINNEASLNHDNMNNRIDMFYLILSSVIHAIHLLRQSSPYGRKLQKGLWST